MFAVGMSGQPMSVLAARIHNLGGIGADIPPGQFAGVAGGRIAFAGMPGVFCMRGA